MDPKQIVKQMIAFNKSVFDNNFATMSTLQEQTGRLVNKFWENTPMFPEEGKKAVSDWIDAYKKGCQDLRNTVDENFKKIEEYFVEKNNFSQVHKQKG